MSKCSYPEGHQAHMAVNGECPWCGTHDAEQSEFGWVDQSTGTIYAASGDVIEEGEVR